MVERLRKHEGELNEMMSALRWMHADPTMLLLDPRKTLQAEPTLDIGRTAKNRMVRLRWLAKKTCKPGIVHRDNASYGAGARCVPEPGPAPDPEARRRRRLARHAPGPPHLSARPCSVATRATSGATIT